MYYRYEIIPTKTKYPNTGIIAGLREFFDRETGRDMISSLDKYLSVPPNELDRNGVYSFFTERGAEFFKDDLDKIIKAYKELGIDIIKISIEEMCLIKMYEDEFQVLGQYSSDLINKYYLGKFND